MATPQEPSTGGVLTTITQVNGILLAGLTILSVFKAARDAWKASHPAAGDPFPTDEQLIDLLRADADHLVAHADAILQKYDPADPAPPDGIV